MSAAGLVNISTPRKQLLKVICNNYGIIEKGLSLFYHAVNMFLNRVFYE